MHIMMRQSKVQGCYLSLIKRKCLSIATYVRGGSWDVLVKLESGGEAMNAEFEHGSDVADVVGKDE